jgi:hypothetical protein
VTDVNTQLQLDDLRGQVASLRHARRRSRLAFVLGAMALVAVATTATKYVVAAANSPTPKLVPYRGVLKQNGLVVPNGAKQMVFRLYDQAGTGGNQIWGPETKSVTVADGVFSVTLGDSMQLTDAQLQSSALWLDITVEGQSLTPRQQLLAAPYARRADVAVSAFNGSSPGAITAFGANVVPPGWLLCDGAQVSRTTYADLFAAIGTTWGAGDGSTTFNVPDLRGMFLRGTDPTALRDPDGASRSFGSTQGSLLGHHAHSINDPGHSHQYYGEGDGCTGEKGLPRIGPGSCVYGLGTSASGTGITLNETGGSESRPTNVSVEYIVKF